MGNRQPVYICPEPRYTLNLGCNDERSWPHLVGRPVREAVSRIQRVYPNLYVIPMQRFGPIPYDLNCNRVIVFYDRYGLVSSTPVVG